MPGLDDAVKAAARWQGATEGDSNLHDVVGLVRGVEAGLGLSPSNAHPSTDDGVTAVELVEARLFHDRTRIEQTLIRMLPTAELVRRCANVADGLQQQRLLGEAREPAFIAALYAWHGCLNMAKTTRRTYRALVDGVIVEVPYTLDDRWASYNFVREEWLHEDARGNTWVRYGVSLARELELQRDSKTFAARVVEDWIPKDSPYWEG